MVTHGTISTMTTQALARFRGLSNCRAHPVEALLDEVTFGAPGMLYEIRKYPKVAERSAALSRDEKDALLKEVDRIAEFRPNAQVLQEVTLPLIVRAMTMGVTDAALVLMRNIWPMGSKESPARLFNRDLEAIEYKVGRGSDYLGRHQLSFNTAILQQYYDEDLKGERPRQTPDGPVSLGEILRRMLLEAYGAGLHKTGMIFLAMQVTPPRR